jgi:hypothetical protein
VRIECRHWQTNALLVYFESGVVPRDGELVELHNGETYMWRVTSVLWRLMENGDASVAHRVVVKVKPT